jgi:hypothetical protein
MEMTYEERLKWLHQLCQAQANAVPLSAEAAKSAYANADVEEAAHYLASFLTFQAIRSAERHPADELQSDFDMLGVYQCFGLMLYAFLLMPLTQDGHQPDYARAQVTIGKTLFAGLARNAGRDYRVWVS